MAAEESDDVPALSADTFLALKEFYREQEARENARREIIETASTDLVDSISAFDEDWQLSQFWYDDATAEALAKECARIMAEKPGAKVACISCPTLYIALRKLLPDDAKSSIKLFEFDKRFSRFGRDFIFYDYKSPLDIPRELREEFDLVFADPPFLSDECLTKVAVTIKFLAKQNIILCTGAIMEELAGRLLSLKICKFVPHHRHNFANEFRCFSNYNLDSFMQLS